MDEAEIRESLLARLEKAGALDAAGRDLAEMYLDARKRMAVAREQGETRQAQAELVTMARLMTMMGIAPESRRRAALEKEISEQLEAKHLQGPVFDDWKNRFLILWDSFQAADKCLKERGRSYIAMSAAGNKYEKDNSASKEIIALSRAMHDALQAMDITVTGYTDPDDDEL